jgi:heme exporter protein D
MALDQEHFFGGASTANCTNCGTTPPNIATVPGILRIWTAVTASLVQTVTTWRGGRQEVILLTQVMAQTAREAAVMAAMLGQQGDEEV